MVGIATLLTTLALAPTGVWAGSSNQAPSVSLSMQGGTVVQASAWASVYDCDLGGNVGPAAVTVHPHVHISSTGRIHFTAGKRSRRLSASLRYRKGVISGRIKVTGQLAGPCSSPSIAVKLTKR